VLKEVTHAEENMASLCVKECMVECISAAEGGGVMENRKDAIPKGGQRGIDFKGGGGWGRGKEVWKKAEREEVRKGKGLCMLHRDTVTVYSGTNTYRG